MHRYIFLFGLFSLAFGMMIGTVPTSVPQFILMGNWLMGGNFREKWERLRGNRIFWALSSVFLIHVLGLLHTTDASGGWDAVRTKIPLMFLPMLLFSEAPLSTKEFRFVLQLFLIGSVANTAWCLLYSFALHPVEVVRNTSRFMSHIRLGLYLNLAIAASLYFLYLSSSLKKKWLWALLAFYFLLCMYVLGLVSGMANFLILSFFFLCRIILRQRTAVKLVSLLVLLALCGTAIRYVSGIAGEQLKVRPTPNNRVAQKSIAGNLYIHFDTAGQKENGNYVLMNIQLEELQRAWKREFPADSFSYDHRHNLGRYEVLVRYMASKGLNKDSAGYTTLDAADKSRIVKGIANHRYDSWSFLHRRVYELVNEYDDFMHNRYINGHSLTMRLYFWQAAAHLIRQYPLVGVGSGDVQQELNKTYVAIGSPLEEEWYKRPHNQFITITVALGVCGLAVFLFSIVYPLLVLRKKLHLLYWPFFLLAQLSFLLEDTLETQAGLTFYAFFNTLFISHAYYRARSLRKQRPQKRHVREAAFFKRRRTPGGSPATR